MHSNPKLNALKNQQNHAERLFGKDAPLSPPPAAVAVAAAETRGGDADRTADGDVVRKSYMILRGRIEPLPKLRLMNRHGAAALVDYSIITWIDLRPAGELVLHVLRGGEAYTITITGRGLGGELLDGLQEDKVEWIRELDELAAAAAYRSEPEAGVVTGIRIAKESVPSAW